MMPLIHIYSICISQLMFYIPNLLQIAKRQIICAQLDYMEDQI